MGARLQIGELAALAGVTHRTIHYYERLGLLHPAEREGSGYRYYDELALKRLNKIAALKKLGLSLDEIATVIDLYFTDDAGVRGKERVLAILKRHLAETNTRLTELAAFREEIKANIARIERLIVEARAPGKKEAS